MGYPADFGALIGLERELRSKPVGLKTIIVVSVISCFQPLFQWNRFIFIMEMPM
ncbi:MgtC/SapB family protein [Domibacillus indicus]|uniref:MgtC/SapB family protein n=1 Tax=Domibacillus indicus TaxID=1437523 RepID=UPI00203C6449|nr:MgtC/SapB family protein [Domibacillus indicus]MCM3787044.1 MgtC/SapB family protein [Domibacillus indicus]